MNKIKQVQQAQAATGRGDNPFLNAKEEWLERHGTYIAQAAQWRIAAILALVLAVLSQYR